MGVREPSSADHGGDVLYDIGKSPEVGRYMLAKRDVKPGEVIFTDQPAVIGPDSNSLPLCTVCWRYRIRGTGLVFITNFQAGLRRI